MFACRHANRVVPPRLRTLQVRFLAISTDGPKRKQQKVKKKKKGGRQMDESVESKQTKLVISALDAPAQKEPPLSSEEQARRMEIGRNYVVGMFEEHNDMDHDLTCKIHMKQHAIKMLPRNSRVRDEALIVDYEAGPPTWRNIPVWTPPIADFDITKFEERENEDD